MVTLDLRERERTSQSTLREKASEPSDAVLLTLASSKIQRFLAKKKNNNNNKVLLPAGRKLSC